MDEHVVKFFRALRELRRREPVRTQIAWAGMGVIEFDRALTVEQLARFVALLDKRA